MLGSALEDSSLLAELLADRRRIALSQTEAGFTRFQRWHIDNPFYKNWPARVTTIWAHTVSISVNDPEVGELESLRALGTILIYPRDLLSITT